VAALPIREAVAKMVALVVQAVAVAAQMERLLPQVAQPQEAVQVMLEAVNLMRVEWLEAVAVAQTPQVVQVLLALIPLEVSVVQVNQVIMAFRLQLKHMQVVALVAVGLV
tara:strand:+ start:289 stop:618 length:330 start_codon:yes stop_codon:yes gene_type:complete